MKKMWGRCVLMGKSSAMEVNAAARRLSLPLPPFANIDCAAGLNERLPAVLGRSASVSMACPRFTVFFFCF